MFIAKYTAAAVLALMLAAPAALAHHLWIERSDDGWEVIRGIIPDDQENYDPGAVQEVAAFGKDGRPLTVERIDEDGRVFFTTNGAVAMATTWSAWGYRVNTTRGKRLIGRAEAKEKGLRVLSAFFSTHYARSHLAPCDTADEPTGLRFEIVPMEDPVNVPAGSEMAFQVRFNGEPLEGTALYSDNGDDAITDENGTAVASIPDKPTALFYARHRIDVAGDEKKDYKIFTTFLTFEVNR